MSVTMQGIENLRAEMSEAETSRYLAWRAASFPDSDHPADRVTAKERRDFWALDIGSSGAFMVRKADGAVFGIKGYGTPDYRKGICFLGEMSGDEVLAHRHRRGPFRIDMRGVVP